MKSFLTTTLAIAMIAGSSIAFAADDGGSNGGNNNGGKNSTTSGADQTGTMDNSGTDSPDQAEMERCKTAPADDAKCAGLPKN